MLCKVLLITLFFLVYTEPHGRNVRFLLSEKYYVLRQCKEGPQCLQGLAVVAGRPSLSSASSSLLAHRRW